MSICLAFREPRSGFVRARLLPLVAVSLLAACADRDSPTDPSTAAPEPTVQMSILDGTDAVTDHENFFFLPPIAENEPAESVENDSDFLPHLTIEICEWTDSGCVLPLVAELTPGMPPGQGGIGVEEDEEGPGHFIANWHTRGSEVSPSTVYRIRVFAGTIELGHADVVILEDASEASRYDPSEFISLVEGGTLPIKFRLRQDRIEGAPGAPVGTEVPPEDFIPNPEDYTRDHPTLGGMPIAHNTILLAFDPSTTVAQANVVLDEINGQVVGAIPSPTAALPAILFLRLPTPDHGALVEILAGLRADASVLNVVQDVRLSPTLVTGTDGAEADWRWNLLPAGGNWGFERSRVPQMWNLNPGIRKARGDDPAGAVAGVVDVGFADQHEDLAYDENLTPGVLHFHGTHVSGTIGATHDNDLGVDGLNPFARLVVKAPDFSSSGETFELRSSWGGEMMQGYGSLLADRPDVRVVNMSLGYNWQDAGIDSDTNADAQEVADEQGVIFAFGQALLESNGVDLPFLVAAAGNDDGKDARYGSPMTNAAIVQGEANIIVVEATNIGNDLASFSNTGGHVSAPGVGILSTILSNAYESKNGTSVAAPHVAGLVSYLYTLDPTLPGPTRTDNAIGDLILANAVDDVGGAASARMDAYATAMDVDRIQGNDRVLRMLLDIDDGTRDGNRRTALNGAGDYPVEDADGDGGQGDGQIDMADFRRWRDWLLDTDDSFHAELDGSPDHPKTDANGDGLPSTGFELAYSRGDFNGDAFISIGHRAPVPGALAGQSLTDLEVLQSRFADPDYDADDLDDLIFSADLRVSATDCFAVAPLGGTVRTTLTGSGSDEGSNASFGWFASRTHELGDPVELFTERVARSPDATVIHARTEVVDAIGTVVASAERDFDVWPASDRRWTPQCGGGDGVDLFLVSIEESADPIVETETVTYSVQAGNSSASDASAPEGSVIELRMTAGDATFESASEGCEDVSSTGPEPVIVRCGFGPLAPGAVTASFDVQVAPADAPQTLEMSVEVRPGPGFTELDPSDNTAVETTTVNPVEGITQVYVVNQTSDNVSVVDWATDAVVATIAVGDNPFAGHLTPDGSELWVAHGSGSVDIVSTDTQAATIGVFGTGSGVHDFAFSPDGSTAYFTRTSSGSVAVVDVATRTVTTTISGLSFPRGIAILPGGSKAYVPGHEAIYVLDLATNALTGTIPVDGNAFHAVAAPDNSAVYVTQRPSSGPGLVRTIDPSIDALAGSGIAVGSDPFPIEIDPSGSEVYVADANGSLWFVDVGAGSVITSIGAPANTSSRIDRTSDGSLLFLSSYSDPGVLTEIETATRSVSATTAVGAHPVGVAVRP